ncbi:MAG: DUF2752 domain-containing protein [Bacteroidota bacterium]
MADEYLPAFLYFNHLIPVLFSSLLFLNLQKQLQMYLTDKTNRGRLILLIIIIIASAGLLLVNKSFLTDEGNSFCIHKSLLGFECPLCGLTRAAYSLFHFRIWDAISHNIAVVPLVLFVLNEIAALCTAYHNNLKVRKILLILLVSMLAGLYLYRICFFAGVCR